MKIGNGLEINVWKYPWIPSILNQILPSHLQLNQYSLIQTMVDLCVDRSILD